MTEDKLKIDTVLILNTTKKKQNNTKHYPGLVAFYNNRPGNEVGLFYNAPEPMRVINRCDKHDSTLQGSVHT